MRKVGIDLKDWGTKNKSFFYSLKLFSKAKQWVYSSIGFALIIFDSEIIPKQIKKKETFEPTGIIGAQAHCFY